MREHEKVNTLDPIFVEATELLFGGAVDARELWDVVSKQDDASEVHVNAGIRKKPKAKKTIAKGGAAKEGMSRGEIRTGQALNVLATAGGGLALYHAGKRMKLARKGVAPGGKAPKWVQPAMKYKALRPLAQNPKRALMITAGGAMGLHSAELAADVIAARSLHQQGKKLPVKKQFDALIAARRAGLINTEQAILAAEEVEKAMSFRPIFRPLPSKASIKAKAALATKAGRAKKFVNDSITNGRIEMASAAGRPRAVRTALTATGVTAGAGAGAYGYSRGKKRGLAQAPQLPAYSQALKPAPVKKSNEFTTTWTGEISKVDEDKRQVFGWCSLSELDGQPVVDLQGDYVPIEEIEKSAYGYVLTSRKGGDMHARDGESPLHTADMIESFVVTPEKLKQMGLPEDSLPLGWWVGFKVNDDKQWELVKKGERTGFSIHGKGSRTSKMLED